MICLTTDLHHYSLGVNEIQFLRAHGDYTSEVKAGIEYLKLCEKYNVKYTVYTTGKTFAEEWDQFRPISESPLVEVGGHTYEGLPRGRFSKLWAAMTGSVSLSHGDSHGSYAKQKKDVRKTADIIRRRTGKDIVSWRSHGFVYDDNTHEILVDMGIKYISDALDWDNRHPVKLESGLISHPLNVIEDHDHIYHAHRTKELVAKQQKNWSFKDDPTTESYTIEKWADIAEQQVLNIESSGGVATILLHPLCMYTADRFKTFERMLKVFAQHKTIWACEVGEYVS